jgi:hypothetical protein
MRKINVAKETGTFFPEANITLLPATSAAYFGQLVIHHDGEFDDDEIFVQIQDALKANENHIHCSKIYFDFRSVCDSEAKYALCLETVVRVYGTGGANEIYCWKPAGGIYTERIRSDADKFPVPKPEIWAAVHQSLEQCREEQIIKGSKVPIPLILGGASFSTANMIRSRWKETLAWAKNNQCMDRLLMHYVMPPYGQGMAEEIAGSCSKFRGDGLINPCWNTQQRLKPNDLEVRDSLILLKSQWEIIAGVPLAALTKPIEFTGRKSRRLLVSVVKDGLPEWGTWVSVRSNPRAFSDFRRRINDAIYPMEIDHVDFVNCI